jgi:hypothetical protein
MTQQTAGQAMSGRALALARRKALSGAGKLADKPSGPDRTRADSMTGSAAPTSQGTARAPVSAPLSTPRNPARTSPAAAGQSSRAAALARRKAMSSKGKVAAVNRDRLRDGARSKPVAEAAVSSAARKESDCGCGCNGNGRCMESVTAKPTVSARLDSRAKVRGPRRNEALKNPGRTASIARRRAQSSRGKAGVGASGMTPAQTARATQPELSGRELARALREQRSRRGGAGQKKSAPTGRQRPARNSRPQGTAQDAPWKVGASDTARGQTVTGTMVGRSRDVTGDEASTCRTVTGTEYMGADIFREFCQAAPEKSFNRVGTSATSGGNRVTGNEVGRSTRVTGDEPGTCKNVTGTEYMGAEQSEAFCGTRPARSPAGITSAQTRGGKTVTGNNVGRSGKVTGDETGADRVLTGTQYMQGNGTSAKGAVPAKVGTTATLRGGSVTGTMVGRHTVMTGDEAGSCRNVTGDDYIGQEQFGQFCEAIPKPKDRKVGVSATLGGERVTGTMTGRGERVTGDEPGTCKAITGTPYAGAEQYRQFCEPSQAEPAAARMHPGKRRFGTSMTGIQPSVGGRMTGDEKGACKQVSGTPYVGTDQAAAACPATAADPGAPDFPQPLGGTAWGQFSIVPPLHASRDPQPDTAEAGFGVTGTGYENGRAITGPFGMATGKVTGTEEARFGRGTPAPAMIEIPPDAGLVHGRVKSRITGEGMDAGPKVTGDDWNRGDRVTGTEGASALVRNPSRRGPVVAMTAAMAAAMARGRPEAIPDPVSMVTGGSGNTEKGALITYSGGARG